MKEMLVGIIGFWIILGAMLLAIMPILSYTIVDWAHPIKAEWKIKNEKQEIIIKWKSILESAISLQGEKNEKREYDSEVKNILEPLIILQEKRSEKEAVIEWENENSADAMNRFQEKMGLPFRLSINQSIYYGMLLSFLFLFVMGFAFNLEKQHGDQVVATWIVIAAFSISACLLIYLPIKDYYNLNVSTTLKSVIADQALAKEVISFFWFFTIVGRMIIPIFCLFIWIKFFDRIYFLLLWPFRKWKEATYNSILRTLLGDHRKAFQIFPDGTIELSQFKCKFQLIPMPAIVLSKDVVNRISIDNFFNYLVSKIKDIVFKELRLDLIALSNKSLQTVGKKPADRFVDNLISYTNNIAKGIIAKQKQEMLKKTREQSTEMIEKITNKSLLKFKNELANIGRGEIEEITRNLKTGIEREIITKLDFFIKDKLDSEAVLLPNGVRLFYKVEDYTFAVIEQPPQTRTVFVDCNLSNSISRKSYNVAFPFVIFIVKFYRNHFSELYVFYRNEPLQSTDDIIYRSNFSNVYKERENADEGQVCLNFQEHKERNLVGKINEVIFHFWNSEFNSDLSSVFSQYSKKEPRLKNFETWEKESETDPLFPLSVKWYDLFSLKLKLKILLPDNFDILKNIKKQIGNTFIQQEDKVYESLKRKFSKIEVNGRYSEIQLNIIEKYEKDLIKESLKSIPISFKQANDGKVSRDDLLCILNKAMEKVLTDNYNEAAQQVSVEKQFNVSDLFQKYEEEK